MTGYTAKTGMDGYTVDIHLVTGQRIVLRECSLRQVTELHESLSRRDDSIFVVNGKQVRVQSLYVVQVVVDPAP